MTNRRLERRRHKRHDLPCPISLLDGDGTAVIEGRTANVSDGGVYIPLPKIGSADRPLPRRMTIRLSVPRSTLNTFMLEHFHSQAELVRADPAGRRGLALAFTPPLLLDLGA